MPIMYRILIYMLNDIFSIEIKEDNILIIPTVATMAAANTFFSMAMYFSQCCCHVRHLASSSQHFYLYHSANNTILQMEN